MSEHSPSSDFFTSIEFIAGLNFVLMGFVMFFFFGPFGNATLELAKKALGLAVVFGGVGVIWYSYQTDNYRTVDDVDEEASDSGSVLSRINSGAVSAYGFMLLVAFIPVLVPSDVPLSAPTYVYPVVGFVGMALVYLIRR
ncbi:hypothetical protein [Halorientalis pallida]|uniref:DUF2178 domain-containing protein n=1 Tax=Halorientalis pallida TaxID=2479928 RepID=A0A498KR11_9EURY|nr:hypothetical protein [Halorientalis pallida]RXK46669.1 hypothetical protein EAF64_18515 [Halorientalis pallida]